MRNDQSDRVTPTHILITLVVIVVMLAPFISNFMFPSSEMVAFLFGGPRLIAYYAIVFGVAYLWAKSEAKM